MKVAAAFNAPFLKLAQAVYLEELWPLLEKETPEEQRRIVTYMQHSVLGDWRKPGMMPPIAMLQDKIEWAKMNPNMFSALFRSGKHAEQPQNYTPPADAKPPDWEPLTAEELQALYRKWQPPSVNQDTGT